MASSSLKDLFLLDPEVTFLNHGSFGACPRPVFETYQQWQLELERQPVQFLMRAASEYLAESRATLANFFNVSADSIVHVANATWGINVAIKSLEMSKGDEILTTNHEYGANNLAWEWLLAKSGAKLVRQAIDTPVVSKERIFEQLFSGVTSQTRAIFLSHITSATALIMPIREICAEARKLGILTIVDGAHAPGQIPVDIQDLGADIYAGNLHKWMCAPKGAGFLYVAPEQQGWVESLIVSWGWGPDGELAQSTFVERNEWQGTRDLASFLSVPAAIEFQETHNWDRVRARCHALAASTRTAVSDLTGLEPISPDSTEWFGQMVSCPIETPNTEELKTRLYDDFRIEVPIGCWNDKPGMRVSYQGYNDENDLDRLMSGLHALL